MITPVEYRISCDSGNACKGKIMMHRLIPNRATVRATSTRDAAKKVRGQGWIRRRVDGHLIDLCPACAS